MLKKLLLNLFMLLVIVHLKDGSVLKYDADDVYTFGERVNVVKTVPKEEYEKLKKVNKQNSVYFSDWKIERTDPILIQVVEELGEEANNIHSKLKIIEIPDDVDWYIDEYEGKEWIADKHRIWE